MENRRNNMERRDEDKQHNYRLENIENNVEKVLMLLNGNGKTGIVTSIALHQEKIDNIPTPRTLKVYALMSGASVGFVSFIGYLIVQAFKVAGG